MDEKRLTLRGQIMMWTIVAMIIVSGIILFYFLTIQPPSTPRGPEFNPKSSLQICIRRVVTETADKMTMSGGFIAPSNFVNYGGKKVAYHCYNRGYYATCINQHPMLINELKAEIISNSLPGIEECFSVLTHELKERNREIELGDMKVMAAIAPGRVNIEINRTTTIKYSDSVTSFNSINFELMHPLYDLSYVAMEISNQEAKYCYFENTGYGIIHQRFSITRDTLPDSTRIYTILDKDTLKTMQIATRSCAIPAGLG